MSAITRVLILGLLSLLLASCRGGGDDPMANIVSVSPSGTVGVTTGTVEFSADVDAPGSFTLSWDFDDGTFPATSTDLTPNVTLLLPDTYTGSVDLLIDDVVVDTFPFTYIIAGIPAVTAVSPTGSAGLVRALVDFEATVEGDFDSLAWTFDDGATLLTQDEAIAQARLLDPGIYEGTVTPTLDGVSGSAFPFEYTVDAPVAPTWTVQDVALVDTNRPNVAITEHQGKIAIAFQGPGGLEIAIAKVAQPCCPAEWERHVIDPAGQGRGLDTLVSRNDRLITAYFGTDFDGGNRIAVADVANPTSPADWTIMILLNTLRSRARALHNDPDGPLRLVCDGGDLGLNLAVCTEPVPSSEADWTIHSILETDDPDIAWFNVDNCTLQPRADSLEVAFATMGIQGSQLSFAQSDSLSPDGPEDWSTHLTDSRRSAAQVGYLVAQDNELPMMLYQRVMSESGQDQLVVHQSTVENPTSEADWENQVVAGPLIYPAPGSTAGPILPYGTVLAGRAAFLHRDAVNGRLVIYRQIGLDVTDQFSWTEQILTDEGDPGVTPVAVEIDGALVVAYVDMASGMLRVAYASNQF